MLNGVASWRGWSVRFTDGICDTCLARFRAEHQRFLQKPARAGETHGDAPSDGVRPEPRGVPVLD